MKLELKHLAPYLPYGLKVNFSRNNGMFKSDNVNLQNTAMCHNTTVNETYFLCKDVSYGIFDCKPILRPLSDITEDSEMFESVNNMICGDIVSFRGDKIVMYIGGSWVHADEFPYDIAVMLFEKHYDVFGLIEKGLAININELKEVKDE